MDRLSLRCIVYILPFWLCLVVPSNVLADLAKNLNIKNYGSFIYSDRVPSALFFFSKIKQNDSFELRKALRNHDITTLVLSSAGGSVWESLNMAGIVHDKKLTTYVPEQGLDGKGNCASACAFLFFGGDTRIAKGKLGVHQFYSGNANKDAKIGEAQENAQFTVSEIIGFLNEFETPPFVYERMFQQTEMYYFSNNELEQVKRENVPLTENELENIARFIDDINLTLAEIELQKSVQEVTKTEKIPEVEVEPPAEVVKDKLYVDLTGTYNGTLRCEGNNDWNLTLVLKKSAKNIYEAEMSASESTFFFKGEVRVIDGRIFGYNLTRDDGESFEGIGDYKVDSVGATLQQKDSTIDGCTFELKRASKTGPDITKNNREAGPQKQLVKFVQERLNSYRCNAGVADGVIGPKTLRAASSFNKINNGKFKVTKETVISDGFLKFLVRSDSRACSKVTEEVLLEPLKKDFSFSWTKWEGEVCGQKADVNFFDDALSIDVKGIFRQDYGRTPTYGHFTANGKELTMMVIYEFKGTLKLKINEKGMLTGWAPGCKIELVRK